MDYFITKGRFLIAEFSTLKEMVSYHKKMPRKLKGEVRLNDLSNPVPRYAEGLEIAYGYDDPSVWHSVPEAEETLKRRFDYE